MTGHTPFIFFSYLFGALILAWTAASPLLKQRRILARLIQISNRDTRHDPNP